MDIYFNKNEKVPVISSELLVSMSKQFIKEYNEYKTSKSKRSFIDQFKFATNITVKTSDGVMEIANDEIMEQAWIITNTKLSRIERNRQLIQLQLKFQHKMRFKRILKKTKNKKQHINRKTNRNKK